MMNSIIEAMLRYNRTVLTLLVALFGAGVYSWFILPKEAFPNVTFPSIYVSVYQNGISPEDAEDKLPLGVGRHPEHRRVEAPLRDARAPPSRARRT